MCVHIVSILFLKAYKEIECEIVDGKEFHDIELPKSSMETLEWKAVFGSLVEYLRINSITYKLHTPCRDLPVH